MPGITQFRQPSRKAKQPSKTDLIMRMRLNYNDPKERRIIEALASCGQRGTSRFLKRAAYQLAAGLDYDTDLPLSAHAMPVQSSIDNETPSPKNTEIQRRLSILADLDAGVSDWDSLSA